MMKASKKSSPQAEFFFNIRDLGGPVIGGTIILCDLFEGASLRYRVMLDAGLATENGGKKLKISPLEKLKELLEQRNIDCIILSHAHQDHVGALPWIVKYLREKNIKIPEIYATPLTKKQYQITQREFFHLYSTPAKKTGDEWSWSLSDIEESYQRIATRDYYIPKRIGNINGNFLSFKFYPNGHIFGSCAVELTLTSATTGLSEGRLLYTSDCCLRHGSFTVDGWQSHKFQEEIQQQHHDAVIMEGTYLFNPAEKADRKHIKKELAALITPWLKKGNVVLCVYSIDRAANTLCCLREMIDEGALPHYDIVFDTKTGQLLNGTYKESLEKLLGTIYDLELERLEDYYSKSIVSRWRTSRLYLTQRNNKQYVYKYFVTGPELREEVLDKYMEGHCIVVCTSATFAGGPVMEYIYRWGTNQNNLFLIMGGAIPGTPASIYVNKRGVEMPVYRYNENTKEWDVSVNVTVNAQIKDFPLISAHAIAPELRVITGLDTEILLLTHLGTHLEDFDKIYEKVEDVAKFYSVGNFAVLSPDLPHLVPLTTAARELVFPEDIWTELKAVAKKANENTDRQGLLKTIRKLIDYYKVRTP